MRLAKQVVEINLSNKQRKILEKMDRGTHTPLHFIKRAKIILRAADGIGNRMIARQCNLNRHRFKLWCRRWTDAVPEMNKTEVQNPQALKGLIRATLSGHHRSGRPRYFHEDQVAEILTMACQSPENKGLPISQSLDAWNIGPPSGKRRHCRKHFHPQCCAFFKNRRI
jgi:hypothetical protein